MERHLHSKRPRHLLPVVGAPALDPCIDCVLSPGASARGSLPAALAHRLDADHPDKDGLQLRKIAKVLKAFDKEA